MTKSIIFHHPYPISQNGKSGSSVRPLQMLKAFQDLGFETVEVTGYSEQRKKSILSINHDIARGKQFSLLYSESQTIPIALTEKHHLPLQPTLDAAFFAYLRKQKIPVGLFYRDTHWRFNQIYKPPWHKRLVTLPFYHLEWEQYKRNVDCLFLPSVQMSTSLPSQWPNQHVYSLPPGLNISETNSNKRPFASEPLELLYVGGVTPPLYNLESTFKYVNDQPKMNLTLCCRSDEWNKVKHMYTTAKNTNIVHQSGQDLIPLYNQADIFVILWEPFPYLNFALPVKVFEALGWGLPIITTQGTATSNFVEQEKIGWIVSSKKEFEDLLKHLKQNPHLIHEVKANIQQAQLRHTWKARAQTVVETLANI